MSLSDCDGTGNIVRRAQGDEVVFEYSLQLDVLIVLTVTNFQCLTDLICRGIFPELDPTVKCHIGELDCIELIRFDFS